MGKIHAAYEYGTTSPPSTTPTLIDGFKIKIKEDGKYFVIYTGRLTAGNANGSDTTGGGTYQVYLNNEITNIMLEGSVYHSAAEHTLQNRWNVTSMEILDLKVGDLLTVKENLTGAGDFCSNGDQKLYCIPIEN